MKKLFLSAATFLAATTSAFGADLAARPYTKAASVVTPIYDWTGFYIGGHIGGTWTRADFTTTGVNAGSFSAATFAALLDSATGRAEGSGLMGGAQAGYNWQMSNFLLGLEADVSALAGTAARTGSITVPSALPPTFTANQSLRPDWMVTFRPRVGYVAGPALLYVTGGVAVANFRFSNAVSLSTAAAATEPAISDSRVRAGYAVGGGAEWAFAPHWSVNAEYLYTDFGRQDYAVVFGAGGLLFPQPLMRSYDAKIQIGRIGINYQLGGPTVTRY